MNRKTKELIESLEKVNLRTIFLLEQVVKNQCLLGGLLAEQLRVQRRIFETKSNGSVEIQQQDFYRQTLDRMKQIEGSLVALHNELAKKV